MSETSIQTPPKTGAPVSALGLIPVSRADLPLACPRPADTLWNMHPRVYLPIADEPDGVASCPYCGARYRLSD